MNTPLRTEEEAKQNPNYATQKAWKISNDNVTTEIGLHPAYKLGPSAAFPPMFVDDLPILGRAEVISTLWVTLNARDERWPAGSSSIRRFRDGPAGVDQGQPNIENTDVVLWYTLVSTHHPAGGLADDVAGHRQLLAQTVRLLRVEPRARCRTDAVESSCCSTELLEFPARRRQRSRRLRVAAGTEETHMNQAVTPEATDLRRLSGHRAAPTPSPSEFA